MAIVQTFEIFIDTAEAEEYVRRKLGDIKGSKVRMAIRNAINKTAKEIKKQDERAAKRTFTDKNDLNDFDFKKATTANLEALLKDHGGSVALTHFKWRDGKTVISALINRNRGYKKMIFNGNKAFYNAALNHGGTTIVVRAGAERYPLKKVKSLSSPSAHGAPDVIEQGNIQQIGETKFYQNLEKEIERILGTL